VTTKGRMRGRAIVGLLSFLAFASLVVNCAGAAAQEREGGRGRGFPDWLYSLSGYAFLFATGLLVCVGVALLALRGKR
jgi:hypothetical protein